MMLLMEKRTQVTPPHDAAGLHSQLCSRAAVRLPHQIDARLVRWGPVQLQPMAGRDGGVMLSALCVLS